MFGMQTHGWTSGEQQRENFLVFKTAVSSEVLDKTITGIGTDGTTFSFLPDNLPNRDGKFVVAEYGCELGESPLLSEWGRIPRYRGHGTC